MSGSEWLDIVRTVCVTVFSIGLVWTVAWVIRG